MDGLDFFSPTEGGESYDPAAFERFKEQVKKNGQFVAALRKSEQKQKKKEDALAQILLQFIQANQNSALMILVSRLLEENIPASFILAIIILGNEEIKQAVREHEEREARLALAGGEQPIPSIFSQQDIVHDTAVASSQFSLMNRFSNATISLTIKIALDEWGVGIYQAASGQPFRVLETLLDKQGLLKNIVIDASANVLHSFLVSQDSALFGSRGYTSFFSFCEFMLKGILQKLKEQIENQKQLN